MTSASAVVQECLSMVQLSELSKREKLELEVRIHQAGLAASRPDLTENEARALLEDVCRQIRAICNGSSSSLVPGR